MRLLYVVDGRSPIALNWIQAIVSQGHEVHLASTFPCDPGLPLASLSVIPVAFSSLKEATRAKTRGETAKGGGPRKGLLWGAAAVGLRTAFRQWLGPLTLSAAAARLREVIDRVQPDLIHAMRIPYEGMVSALAVSGAGRQPPLLVSLWGNEFTLHAPSTPLMSYYTRLTLQAATALHADCCRDLRLARAWGFPEETPQIVLPGGGGVQPEIFYPPDSNPEADSSLPTVINSRGIRAYVHNDAFFRSIPEVLKRLPQARFLCTGMAGEAQAERWVRELGLAQNVELLPRQPRSQIADLFRRSQVAVSPSSHDGTPNTFLEALACGCFPVVGDLESLREWLTPGINGLLVDPSDADALAEAILLGLERPELRRRAARHNQDLITQRALHGPVMEKAGQFYRTLANQERNLSSLRAWQG